MMIHCGRIKIRLSPIAEEARLHVDAVLTLSVGTERHGIFSVVNAGCCVRCHLRTLTIADALGGAIPKSYEQNPPAAGNYVDWREQNRVFSEMAIYSARKFTLAQEEQPERIAGAAVSASLFGVLGVSPCVGASFCPKTNGRSRAGGAHQSRLWPTAVCRRSQSGREDDQLDSKNYTIVGVMPERLSISRRNRCRF